MDIKALSIKTTGLAKMIVSPVILKNTFSQVEINSNGIWDTGATNSVITKSAASKLGLVPLQKAMVNGVHGPKEVNVYQLNITLNNRDISVTTLVTECEELSGDGDISLLIGMNIISMGDFSITNFGGNTIMSFRVPSVQHIDFVELADSRKVTIPVIKTKTPGRNDKCPCGSEKKYKHCCALNLN